MAERHGGVDFFISYTGTDHAWAEWIAWQLEAADYRCVLQAWDFRPGENFVVQMRRALDAAERTLAVVSAAYLASVYGSDEWTAAFTHDRPDTTGLLVVRVQEVPLPRLLRPWIYIDLVNLDAEAAAVALLAGVERGRRKPSQPPAFPSARQLVGGPRFPGQGVANLPSRNPNFTGRQQLLDQLARNLQAGHMTAVVGMGGVGKTQLALEYAHRHAADYDLRWWIPAEESLAIPAALAALARRLGLGEQADQEETVNQVLAELGRCDRWLLVFDNAVDPKHLAGYLPSGGGGHVLVTTRSRAFGGVAARIDVGVFDQQEAAGFLQQRTGGGDRTAAEVLAEELEGLPLALEQAAAFMEQTGLGLGEYLRLYRRDREMLLAKGEPVAYGATVDTTFRLAIEQVGKRSEAAELLELCAFLAPEAIPHELLRAAPQVLPAALGREVADELAYAETVGVLHGFSMVERDRAGLRVHRLVQAVARHRLDRDHRAAWAARAVELVRAAWPADSWLPVAWPWCGQLLPHALAAAGHARGVAEPQEATGALLNKVGLYLAGRTETAAALTAFGWALASRQAAYGPDHPEVAGVLSNLGQVFTQRGELAEARAYHQWALAIREAAYGPDHPQVAASLVNLGLVLRELGELATARAHLERAVRIFETAYGPDHPDVAGARGSLGTVLAELGELKAARAELERALAIREAAYGPDHPQVATALNNLGNVLRQLGDMPAARTRLEQSLAIKEAAYGRDHPEVAAALGNLGLVLYELGELLAARAELERAVGIFETAYGSFHPEVARTLSNLGLVLRQLGEAREAAACEQRVQAIRQELGRSE